MITLIARWLQKRRHEKRVRKLRKTQYRLAALKAERDAIAAARRGTGLLLQEYEYVRMAGKIAESEAMIKDMQHDLMEQL